MAESPKGVDDVLKKDSDQKFPAVDVEGELNPATNTSVKVDPISSEVAASLEVKENAEASQEKKEREKNEAMHTLKSAIIISGIIVAVTGVVFAITKKLREK